MEVNKLRGRSRQNCFFSEILFWRVPKLNLLDDLNLRDDQTGSHAEKKVDDSDYISWGTPLSVQNKNHIKPQTPKSSIRDILTPKPEPVNKSPVKNTKAKYYYLEQNQRPKGNLSGRLPPDPTKEKTDNVQDMAKFMMEFKGIVVANLTFSNVSRTK